MGGPNADLNLIIAPMPSNEISIGGAVMPNKLDRVLDTVNLLLDSGGHSFHVEGSIRRALLSNLGCVSRHSKASPEVLNTRDLLYLHDVLLGTELSFLVL